MGDVFGPASSTDSVAVRFDGTTGKLIKNSLMGSSASGDLTKVSSINSVSVSNTSTTGTTLIVCGDDDVIDDPCSTAFLLGTLTCEVVSNVANDLTNVAAVASSYVAITNDSGGHIRESAMFASVSPYVICSDAASIYSALGLSSSFTTVNRVLSGNVNLNACIVQNVVFAGTGIDIVSTLSNSSPTSNVTAFGSSLNLTDISNCFTAGSNNDSAGYRQNCYMFGHYLRANTDGCLLTGDTSTTILTSGTNGWSARFAGGYHLFSNATATVGARVFSGATGWSTLSDPRFKSHIKHVDEKGIYEKHKELEVFTYRYKDEIDPDRIKRIGTDACRFNKAFGNDQLFPACVDKDNRQLISYGDLSYVSLATMKEMQRRISSLQERAIELKLRTREYRKSHFGGVRQ
jgi:hypothetical protein